MMQRHNAVSEQQYPAFLLDSLYCSEERLEGEVRGGEEGEDIVEEGEDLFWRDNEQASLLSKELPNELHKSLLMNPPLVGARREAVKWMLKVNARYSFSSLTAALAVYYFDRFLSRFHPQRERPWMTQLVAVACISLAAKIEETQVPLLLDLQVDVSRFVFEAKTIMRMEILVLSTLQWRMNPVTPISFFDYITRRFGLKAYLCHEFLRRCEKTLLSVLSDSRLTSYLPSVIATATMLHVVNCIEPCVGLQFQDQLLGIIGINKDNVDSCYMLLLEASEGHGEKLNKRKFGLSPASPNGVMDLPLSSDCSNDSWSVASSVSSFPEPLSKKLRPEDQLLQTAAVDFLRMPR